MGLQSFYHLLEVGCLGIGWTLNGEECPRLTASLSPGWMLLMERA